MVGIWSRLQTTNVTISIVNSRTVSMAFLIKLPFYLIGMFLWLPLGLVIGMLNIITLPIFFMAMILFPSFFQNNAGDILSFGTLRRGVNTLNVFLKN